MKNKSITAIFFLAGIMFIAVFAMFVPTALWKKIVISAGLLWGVIHFARLGGLAK